MREKVAPEREASEREFWDGHVPTLEESLGQYRDGPDPNTALMLDAVEPLAGARVLDFACGMGVTSAWLSDRGALVTGLDVSPNSTARAAELCREVGANATFVTGALDSPELASATFDRIVGRFALHHVDCASVAPALAARLRPGGTAAFLETMDTNPVLRLARKHLVGRFRIPRYGTLDEHPLTRRDLDVLARAFGSVRTEVASMAFFHLLDRQVLRYRSRRVSTLLSALDDFLLERLRLGSWSYHQVLVLPARGEAGIAP
jgi:ubiquinone/menaquinone biosynthesis C-methylase UbiE